MNVDRLKNKIRIISKETRVDSQEIWQMYFLERILMRVSMSQFKDNFVLKGGLLIASMIRISNRSTRDIDATIRAFSVSDDSIRKMLNEILTIPMDDGIEFVLQSLKPIRLEDQYGGYRAVILSKMAKVEQHVKVDISTGDVITPKEILYTYKSNFDLDDIEIMSYNIETILAEKIESILSKADLSTRMRDYYDVYVLTRLFHLEIDIDILNRAIRETAIHRNTIEAIEIKDEILQLISESAQIKSTWENYQKKYFYAKDIEFENVVDILFDLLNKLDV